MKIGIDIDGTIINFFPKFLEFYYKEYGIKRNIESINSYYLWECGIGRNKEEVVEMIDKFYDSKFFNEIPFLDGAKESIQKLSLEHKLFIPIARPIRFKEKTERIAKLLGGIPVYYTADFHNNSKNTKLQICKKENADIIIEDCLEYAAACSEAGIKTFLINQPWNHGYSNGIIRVNNWNEIIRGIKNGIY